MLSISLMYTIKPKTLFTLLAVFTIITHSEDEILIKNIFNYTHSGIYGSTSGKEYLEMSISTNTTTFKLTSLNKNSPNQSKVYFHTVSGAYSFQKWERPSCILVYDNTTEIFGLMQVNIKEGALALAAIIPKINLTLENYTSYFPSYFKIAQFCSLFIFKDKIYQVINQNVSDVRVPSNFTTIAAVSSSFSYIISYDYIYRYNKNLKQYDYVYGLGYYSIVRRYSGVYNTLSFGIYQSNGRIVAYGADAIRVSAAQKDIAQRVYFLQDQQGTIKLLGYQDYSGLGWGYIYFPLRVSPSLEKVVTYYYYSYREWGQLGIKAIDYSKNKVTTINMSPQIKQNISKNFQHPQSLLFMNINENFIVLRNYTIMASIIYNMSEIVYRFTEDNLTFFHNRTLNQKYRLDGQIMAIDQNYQDELVVIDSRPSSDRIQVDWISYGPSTVEEITSKESIPKRTIGIIIGVSTFVLVVGLIIFAVFKYKRNIVSQAYIEKQHPKEKDINDSKQEISIMAP